LYTQFKGLSVNTAEPIGLKSLEGPHRTVIDVNYYMNYGSPMKQNIQQIT